MNPTGRSRSTRRVHALTLDLQNQHGPSSPSSSLASKNAGTSISTHQIFLEKSSLFTSQQAIDDFLSVEESRHNIRKANRTRSAGAGPSTPTHNRRSDRPESRDTLSTAYADEVNDDGNDNDDNDNELKENQGSVLGRNLHRFEHKAQSTRAFRQLVQSQKSIEESLDQPNSDNDAEIQPPSTPTRRGRRAGDTPAKATPSKALSRVAPGQLTPSRLALGTIASSPHRTSVLQPADRPEPSTPSRRRGPLAATATSRLAAIEPDVELQGAATPKRGGRRRVQLLNKNEMTPRSQAQARKRIKVDRKFQSLIENEAESDSDDNDNADDNDGDDDVDDRGNAASSDEEDDETNHAAKAGRDGMAHFREQRLKVVLEGESTDGEESEADRESRGVGLLATLGSSFNNYFQSVHDKRHTTSDHTLSQLPPLDHKIFLEISSKTHQILRTERERLGQLHFELFPQWYFELASGFNLLFYGYGSKKKLLTAFVGRYLSDMHQIVVNGYFPSINIKEIMTLILDSIVVHKGPCGTLVDQAQLILSYFSDPKRKHKSICIVVHNIDGDSLRNANAQTVLAMLAGHPQIHLIASIDHINAPLLWDTDKLSRFNWIWHDATTFEPLTIETSYEGSCLRMLTTMGQSEGTSLRGCQYILKSCTVNARKMFKLLAQSQIALEESRISKSEKAQTDKRTKASGRGGKRKAPSRENGDDDGIPDDADGNSNDGRGAGDPDDHDDTGRNGAGVGSKEKVGMTRKAFYQKCKEHFLVSNDITFKTQLREFLDHELIVETGSGTGAVGDIVYIPMNVELLKTVVADME